MLDVIYQAILLKQFFITMIRYLIIIFFDGGKIRNESIDLLLDLNSLCPSLSGSDHKHKDNNGNDDGSEVCSRF